VQAGVLEWWFQFQDLLSEERRRYYSTTKPKDLIGAEAHRQIDLFVKQKNGLQLDAAHNWKDVDVIGELKESNNNKKGTLLQIGRYVRDVFSCQPTRRFVHAFAICGRDMEIWVFDRSGCYSPGAFDIHEKPEQFIQVIAGYTMMNNDELINGQLSAVGLLVILQRFRSLRIGVMSPSFPGHLTGENQRQTSSSWPCQEESRALLR
jgi:hypothetical protein